MPDTITPTPQQEDIRAATATGETVVVEALAGTGKTSTLQLIANDRPRVKMTYCAFNKAIADEAQRKFPRNTVSRTMHSFAFADIMAKRPGLKERLEHQGRIPRWRVAQILRLPNEFEFGRFKLRDGQLAGLVNETIARFCHSAAERPTKWHIPTVPGMDTDGARAALAEFLMPFVDRAWDDLISDRGQLRFTHDVYLKLYSMGDCVLPGEVVLFDEAQDADPVIKLIVDKQAERGSQIIVVGDSNQQIYAWRGAVDAIEEFETNYRMPLTKSFRFGPAFAEEANRLLSLLPTDLRVEGHDPVDSQLAILDSPDVVLCRTNAEAVGRLMDAQVRDMRAGLVGGTYAVEALATAARDLTEGRRTYHPELQAFDSWDQVRQYASEESDAKDLQVLVKLVDQHGPERLLEAVGRAVPEAVADLVISTSHKAKGREWDRVLLADDFPPPVTSEGDISEPEVRLAYVAVTRGKHYLDSSSLDYVDAVARRQGTSREFLPAEEVPVREVVVASGPSRLAQVMVDPEAPNRVIMTGTKYDPALVEAQKQLPTDIRPNYRGEYCGFERVRIVLATHRVMQVVERFGLTITDEARERIEQFS